TPARRGTIFEPRKSSIMRIAPPLPPPRRVILPQKSCAWLPTPPLPPPRRYTTSTSDTVLPRGLTPRSGPPRHAFRLLELRTYSKSRFERFAYSTDTTSIGVLKNGARGFRVGFSYLELNTPGGYIIKLSTQSRRVLIYQKALDVF